MTELQAERLGRRFSWPEAVIAFGLSVTGIGIGLLGYGLISLIGYAI